MSPRLGLAIVVALTLLPVSDAGAAQPAAVFAANEIDATQVEALVGQLNALNAIGDGNRINLRLDAGAIGAQLDYHRTARVGITAVLLENHTTDLGRDFHAVVSSGGLQTTRVWIADLPGETGGVKVQSTSDQGRLGRPLESEAAAPRLTSNREPQVVSIRDSVHWSPGPDDGLSTLRVSGNFSMIVWGLAISLANAEGTTDIRTGDQVEPTLPHPDSAAIAATTERRALYLEVRDGVLDIKIPNKAMYEVMLASVDEARSDTLEIDLVDGGTFKASDTVRWSARIENDALQVRLLPDIVEKEASLPALESTGSARAPTTYGDFVDPEAPIDVQGQIPAESLANRSWLLAAGVVLVIAAGVRAIHTRARFIRAEQLFAQDDHAAVDRLTNALRWSLRFRNRAGPMRLVALAQLGRFEEAYNLLHRLEERKGASPDAVEYLEMYLVTLEGGVRPPILPGYS